ncbi:MAG: DNA polymerase III subunit gamma/tau [Firmicutes bacterium]|nr:DNA polymerase III subunit gamma/tau [Bacillota bacterium]
MDQINPGTDKTNENAGESGRLVLHRKWRSRDFEEIVGQEHVVRTLKNALAHGRVAPAYLFSGPRGTGKTSMARILAKALNCPNIKDGEPCNKCRVCLDTAAGAFLDVIEMDAASHTQVEKIREFIVEKVNFRPIEGRRKIYIIDEVHKLSAFSFDALLKTIEEPPSFVVFILATTEPEKLPPTIISRCQRFDFKRIPIDYIMSRLRYISDREKFCIEDGALNLIAQASEGALRDALVILEQAVSFTEGCVTAGEIVSLLGMTHADVLFSFGDIIQDKDTRRGLMYIDEMYREGKDLHRLTIDLLEHFRRLLIVQMVRDSESILQVSDDLFRRLGDQAGRFKPAHLLHIIKELMELRQLMKEAGMERLLWESAVVKLTRWEITPTLEGLNRKIAELERRLADGSGSEYRSAPPAPRPEPPRFTRPPEDNRPPVPPMAPPPAPPAAPPNPLAPAGNVRPPVSQAPPVETAAAPQSQGTPPPAGGPGLNDASFWHLLLREVKKEKINLLAVLQTEGAGKLSGNTYTMKLGKTSTFNREFIEKNRNYIEKMMERIAGKKINLVLRTTDEEAVLLERVKKPHSEFVDEVSGMFGASQV